MQRCSEISWAASLISMHELYVVGGMEEGFRQACCGCCSVAHLSAASFLIISGKQVSGAPTGNAFHYLDFVSTSSILWICFLFGIPYPRDFKFSIQSSQQR